MKIAINLWLLAFVSMLIGCKSTGYKHVSTPKNDPKLMMTWMVAKGNSMHPAIQHNQLVSVSPLPFNDLSEGDIVIYRNRKGDYICHRLYSRNETSWWAKGDDNYFTDREIVTAANYYGYVSVSAGSPENGTEQIDGRTVNKVAYAREVGPQDPGL